MQIQRLQTLFLLMAGVFMGVYCFFPWPHIALFVVNVVAAVLILLSIFMFNNLSLQKKFTIFNILLVLASITLTIVYDVKIEIFSGRVFLPAVALIFEIWAYVRMSKDQKKLRSYDRLW